MTRAAPRPPAPPAPTPDVLAALARKYHALSELRARRDAGAPSPPRAELRALAAEFPGCLRELDTLGGPELARRAAACAGAAASVGAPGGDAAGDAGTATCEPWAAWIAGYHELMRAALAIRARRNASAAHGATPDPAVDAAFAADVLRPPHGRLGVVVLRALAARFATPATTIAAALFPVRRPSPYEL